MDYNTNCGIYKITNLVNGKFYIGSSIDLKRRKNRHFKLLRDNKHHSLHLQRAFNIYGEENFQFQVLKYVADESKLRIIEQEYLDSTKAYDVEVGYNMSISSVCPNFGKGENSHTFGRKGKLNGKSVSVVQLDMDYNYLNVFESANIAQNKTGVDASTIIKVCKGKKKSIKGFRWLYLDDYKSGDYVKETNKPKRAVVQLTLNKDYIETFDSINEAGRKTELNYKNIHSCCNGKRNKTGGYKWMYLEEYEKLKSAN